MHGHVVLAWTGNELELSERSVPSLAQATFAARDNTRLPGLDCDINSQNLLSSHLICAGSLGRKGSSFKIGFKVPS